MARQRAQIAGNGYQIAQACDLAALDRTATQSRVSGKQRRDLLFALFGFKRARAVDEETARPDQSDGMVKQSALQLRKRSKIGLALQPRDIGVPTDKQGASSSTASKGPPGQSVASASTSSAHSPSRAKFSFRRARRSGERS